MMDIRHMEITAVSGKEVIFERPDVRKICFGMVWRPDMDLMSPEQIVSLCRTNTADAAEPTTFYRELSLVLYHYIESTLSDAHDIDVKTLKLHMQKYIAWLKIQINKSASEQRSEARIACATRTRDAKTMELMINRILNANMEGNFLVSIGQSLESILRGNSDPLEIMSRGALVNEYHREVCNKMSNLRQLQGWLDAIAHKNPHMKVIEIGAGNNSITSHALESMQLHSHAADKVARFAQYDHTEISEAFLELAREECGPAGAQMDFKILNIGKDPVS